jgi:hypothetical protein
MSNLKNRSRLTLAGGPSILTFAKALPGWEANVKSGPLGERDSMELRLYDTLTKEKRVFTPIDPSNVRIYVCGPTV